MAQEAPRRHDPRLRAQEAGPQQARTTQPQEKRVHQTEAKVARLEKELAMAKTILEVQGKIAGLLGLTFGDEGNS